MSAFSTLISNVLSKLVTLNEVMSLLAFEVLSKVFNLTEIDFLGGFNFKHRDSVIALVLAPVSSNAYVGHRLPPT